MRPIFLVPPQAPGALHAVRVLRVRCAGAEHRPSDSSRVVCLRLAAPYLPSPPPPPDHLQLRPRPSPRRHKGALGLLLTPLSRTSRFSAPSLSCYLERSPEVPGLQYSDFPEATRSILLPPCLVLLAPWGSFVELWFSFLYQILTYFPVSQFSSGQFSTFLKCFSSLMFGLYPLCSSCTPGPETSIRMWSHKENVVLSKSRKRTTF